MYSPKISEELIPHIYRRAKHEKIPMTEWVNRVIREAIQKLKQTTETAKRNEL